MGAGKGQAALGGGGGSLLGYRRPFQGPLGGGDGGIGGKNRPDVINGKTKNCGTLNPLRICLSDFLGENEEQTCDGKIIFLTLYIRRVCAPGTATIALQYIVVQYLPV